MDPLEQPPRQPSSEPASTRLNPFDDADSASRKRRRTSGSVDIPTDPASDDVYQDQQRRETDLSAPPRTPDRLPSSPTATKRIPHTPSRSTSSDGLRDRRPPDPQSSSKVTINLRTPAREPTMVSGSESELPGSPQSQGSIDAHAEDDVSLVPNQPPDVVDLVHSDRQSSPSSIDSASPPVELIQDPDDDEDINLDESQDAVALPDSFHYSFDPSDRFPYHDSQEALYETADRLVNYLGGSKCQYYTFSITTNWISHSLTLVCRPSTRARYSRGGPDLARPLRRFCTQ